MVENKKFKTIGNTSLIRTIIEMVSGALSPMGEGWGEGRINHLTDN